jgi:hypothetical protein
MIERIKLSITFISKKSIWYKISTKLKKKDLKLILYTEDGRTTTDTSY